MCAFHDFGLTWKCQKMCFGWLHDYLKDVFLKNFLTPLSPSGSLSSKQFQKTLILAFEVIVQPSKALFLTFSCETKIMKITHSAQLAMSGFFYAQMRIQRGCAATSTLINSSWLMDLKNLPILITTSIAINLHQATQVCILLLHGSILHTNRIPMSKSMASLLMNNFRVHTAIWSFGEVVWFD